MLNSQADIAYRNRINASETMSWFLADYSKEASKTKQSSSFWIQVLLDHKGISSTCRIQFYSSAPYGNRSMSGKKL
ncbi:hypothetical protein QQ045_020770 [Rhodiola kirilowii]